MERACLVDEVAVSDSHRIFVHWTSHGTQLQAPHTPPAAAHRPALAAAAATAAAAPASSAPSHHNSQTQGVDIITFNHDRSRILEVNVYRQLTYDERRGVAAQLCPGPLEIRLATLHREPMA
ncbi:hypothetical protein TSOC_002513 [Tetrabaena socialis]|uniref:Uncharacterized protein n=1 Tax=Tetrabaena socialis TaxID=47790 RepID=A0A2J8ADX6_9CHLO|nr:hypothetical protein TSOC_002513 [Tetrabaena socialis]|eukprot:PNH10731.1 hypothetical protein TSOC_002513 [Tetrabaena socialis]